MEGEIAMGNFQVFVWRFNRDIDGNFHGESAIFCGKTMGDIDGISWNRMGKHHRKIRVRWGYNGNIMVFNQLIEFLGIE